MTTTTQFHTAIETAWAADTGQLATVPLFMDRIPRGQALPACRYQDNLGVPGERTFDGNGIDQPRLTFWVYAPRISGRASSAAEGWADRIVTIFDNQRYTTSGGSFLLYRDEKPRIMFSDYDANGSPVYAGIVTYDTFIE